MKGLTLLVRTDGTTETKDWTEGPDNQAFLTYLQEAVGGYVETVPYLDHVDFPETGKRVSCVAFIDEEGKLKGKEYNQYAQHMWRKCDPDVASRDMLVGDMVVVFGDDAFMREL